MTPSPASCRAQLLYAEPPRIDPAWLRVRLNTRLAALGRDLVLHEVADSGAHTVRLEGSGIALTLAVHPAPLGAETFMGAIGAGASAPTRAALIGIVGHHRAHVTLGCAATGEGDAKDATTCLRLLHLSAAALARTVPPLALYWTPTNRLHHGETMRAHLEADLPLGLFLDPRDRSMGPRRHPGLTVTGAEPWLGGALTIRIAAQGRDAAREAALAFVRAALADESADAMQGFDHENQHYRVVRGTEAGGIYLIPTASPEPLDPRAAA